MCTFFDSYPKKFYKITFFVIVSFYTQKYSSVSYKQLLIKICFKRLILLLASVSLQRPMYIYLSPAFLSYINLHSYITIFSSVRIGQSAMGLCYTFLNRRMCGTVSVQSIRVSQWSLISIRSRRTCHNAGNYINAFPNVPFHDRREILRTIFTLKKLRIVVGKDGSGCSIAIISTIS